MRCRACGRSCSWCIGIDCSLMVASCAAASSFIPADHFFVPSQVSKHLFLDAAVVSGLHLRLKFPPLSLTICCSLEDQPVCETRVPRSEVRARTFKRVRAAMAPCLGVLDDIPTMCQSSGI
jgi:hypothetical protein